MWLLKACLRLTFPVPVSSNRFLAPDFDFIFGIVQFLWLLLLGPFVIPAMNAGFTSGLFFWRYDHDHSFSFQLRHLFNFAVVYDRLGKFQQDEFSLFLINDWSSFKENVNLNLGALFQKFDGTVVHLSVETRVEWWWEDSNHENAILKDWAPYGFSSPNDNAVISKTTVYTAKTGYILMNYYWVKISWDDDNGHHLVESSKAYCHD